LVELKHEELPKRKRAAMTNGTLPSKATLASNGLLTPKLIAEKAKPSYVSIAGTLRSDKTSRSRRPGDQSLVRGLLDPKSSSLSLKALARTAAFSGKRLVLEIRDANPVQIVRVSTPGM
jgi:hypothetical protein